MAGFDKHEKYVIEEMQLDLPWSLNFLEKHFPPRIEDWISQSSGRAGDKSECADNIFNMVIPYLVEVLVKRGIYFTVKYPHHPMSQLLLAIPNYGNWAQAALNTVQVMKEKRGSDKIQGLNVAARASFESLCRRTDRQDLKLDQVLRLLREERSRSDRLENLILTRLQPQPPQQQQQAPPPPIQQHQQQKQQQPPPPPIQHDEDDGEMDGQADDDDGSDGDEPDNNVNIRLRNSTRVPAINTGMPLCCFRDVLQEWNREDLGPYDGITRKDKKGGLSIYSAWKRRKYCK
jgi:hypothetical protein